VLRQWPCGLDGIDPQRDLTIVEMTIPNQGAAIREKRVGAASCYSRS
jgi:hypothetical protein